LKSLYGFDNLGAVQGNFYVIDNEKLSSLEKLSNLETVQGVLEIRNNSALTNLFGLHNLSSVLSVLRIDGNDGLINIADLGKLTSIGSLEIYYNDNLESLAGLEHLNSINGELKLSSNNKLVDLTGLNNIVSVDSTLQIDRHRNLVSLSGLDKLSTVGGHAFISLNDELLNLSALSNLSSIDGGLWIYGNPKLNNLVGLENLISINGRLQIYSNITLTSLQGIQNLDPNSVFSISQWDPEFVLQSNPSLSSCSIKSICDALYMSDKEFFIVDNSTGCNSETEIEADCYVSTEETNTNIIKLFPNPVQNKISINSKHKEQFEIFNHLGKRMKTVQISIGNNEINTSGWNSGLYFVLTSANESFRIIKQ
jgi:hypothetical protein